MSNDNKYSWRAFNIRYRKRSTSFLDIRRIFRNVNIIIGRNVFDEIFTTNTNRQTGEKFLSENKILDQAMEHEDNMSIKDKNEKSTIAIKGLDGMALFKFKVSDENNILQAFREVGIYTHLCPNAEQIITNYDKKVIDSKSNVAVGDRVRTTSDIIGLVDEIKEDGKIVIMVDILNSTVFFEISESEVKEILKS